MIYQFTLSENTRGTFKYKMAMSSGLFNGLDTTRISSMSLNSSFSFFFSTANTSSGWSTYWKGDGVSDTRKIMNFFTDQLFLNLFHLYVTLPPPWDYNHNHAACPHLKFSFDSNNCNLI